MKRSQLSDMSIFVEVAKANGFRAAANNMKLGAGSVSEAIQRFEDRLGVRLFDRTTRKIALTTLGSQLYKRSLPAINDLENAVNEINESTDNISGTLKLNAPRSSGPFFLDKLVSKFLTIYPEVDIELIFDDSKIDLVSSGVDAAIRSKNLLEKDTHAISIGPELMMTIVASPEYLQLNGIPKTPDDLLNHDGIYFAFNGPQQLAPWVFENSEGNYAVAPNPRIIVNDLYSMLNYAQEGLGLAYIYSSAAEQKINSGEIVEVLKGKVPSLPKYTINYLSKRHMTNRLRAFIDMAKTNH